jgi:DNA-3-methyladenine glycosylase
LKSESVHPLQRLRRLRRAELSHDAADLARFLIGKTLVRDSPEGRASGRIVEAEAYVVGDAAGHAYRGQTARNRSLFLRRGHAYVYFTYGTHFCVNVSAETVDVGAGVLIRALEPLEGIELMQRRRGSARLNALARGPGCVAQALGIDRELDGVDLCARGDLWLADSVRPAGKLAATVRIGITKEAARLLRFVERGSPFQSGPPKLRR